ncbi:glycerophosphodiester phosphodiesterase [Shewanella intestini]|uniref:Glycerophosphodiester phosphodiesterase n=1 Tax=Shewanella intestini TaxID=2017544 RepID=A0ABS5I2P0_9GAMM|nr:MULTISPECIES: glycerophosphodiester phosphodiesterase family protein [Shewanella]MBR9727675.1 glycerophosphodiester phosphodiesterase [Shewanella intestini]MRG35175.1 glycerophosphodiester phosphodiesterase [Shewanella sp. XMDDZSB0408]
MLVFAHRGASGYQPENTLAAMKMAIELGVQAIELDIHNVEGELYVYHDRRLEKKSDGFGPVHLTTKQHMTQLRVLGEPIPTLWEVLTVIDGRCMVNIELKGCFCLTPFLTMYPKILSKLNFSAEQLLISSFNHHYLMSVRQQFPQAYVAPLVDGVPITLAQVATQLQAYSINLSINFVNQAIIKDAHQRGVKVFVYTVDEADDIKALQHINVDGIFSNYPDKAQAIIEATAQITQDTTMDSPFENWFE